VHEIGEQCDHHLRRASQSHRDFSRYAERPFAADESPEQVITCEVRAAAAEVDYVAGGQHDLQTENVIRGRAVFQAMRPARVFGPGYRRWCMRSATKDRERNGNLARRRLATI